MPAISVRELQTARKAMSAVGATGSWNWIQTPKNFNFPGDDILSTDASEGVRRLTLNY